MHHWSVESDQQWPVSRRNRRGDTDSEATNACGLWEL